MSIPLEKRLLSRVQAEVEWLRAVVEAARALSKTTRCYRRPDSKLEPDPGPCGKCLACRLSIALDDAPRWSFHADGLGEARKEQEALTKRGTRE